MSTSLSATARCFMLMSLLAGLLAACGTTTPAPTPTAPAPPTAVPATATTAPASAASAPANTPTSASQAQMQDPQNLGAELVVMLQKIEAQKLLSGSVLVARDGQVILSKGYGLADHDKKISNTPQTRFPIGGLTQQFTALAVLMLQEEGKLDVQDNICKYLSECPDAWKAITIHQLLTYSSGLPDFITSPEFHTMMDKPQSRAQIVALFKDKPLDFQPGEKPNYNATGMILLGEIIERASGQSYQEFLQKNILDPLKMADTTFGSTGRSEALGYASSVSKSDPIDVTNLSSAGALYSTVEDLNRWQEAIGSEQLVSRASWNAMLKKQLPYPGSAELGAGYGLVVGRYLDRPYVGYNNYLPGFQGVFDDYPEDKVTVIFLGNQENNDPGTMTDLIEKKIFGVK